MNNKENRLIDDYTSHTEYDDNDNPRSRVDDINYTYDKLIKLVCVCGLVFMVLYWCGPEIIEWLLS